MYAEFHRSPFSSAPRNRIALALATSSLTRTGIKSFRGEAVLEFTVTSANLWLFEKLADTNMKLSGGNHKGTKTEKKEAVLQTKTELLEDE